MYPEERPVMIIVLERAITLEAVKIRRGKSKIHFGERTKGSI